LRGFSAKGSVETAATSPNPRKPEAWTKTPSALSGFLVNFKRSNETNGNFPINVMILIARGEVLRPTNVSSKIAVNLDV